MITQNKTASDGKITILDLSFHIDPSFVTKRIKFRGNRYRVDETAETLTNAVVSIARPKALYRICKVRRLDDSNVDIEGVRLTSRVLSKLFIDQNIAFPYVVTIGPELAEYNNTSSDMLTRFWLDNTKEIVLHSAGRSLEEHLQKNYPATRLTHMNPGEIDDWPISQQKVLFSLFGNTIKKINITLTDGGVIKPIKSRSGIYFPNNNGFETCRLCFQLKCPGRRAAYNADVVAEYIGKSVS